MKPRLWLLLLAAALLVSCDKGKPPGGGGAPPAVVTPAPSGTPPIVPPPPTHPTGQAPPAPELKAPAGCEEAVVKDVHDGDTITLEDGRKVRYIGIDTPELVSKTVKADEPFSHEARDRNKQLVLGRKVRLEIGDEKQDHYGRTLAYIWIADASGKDLMVNEVLAREGLATSYPFSTNKRHADLFKAAQSAARRAGVGLWKDPPKSDEKYYVAFNAERFHRPSCKEIKDHSATNEARFATRDEALDSGRSPCRTCKP